MMNEQFFFPTISSSLFDTYLVYGIIGLLIFIAIIGLFVLLTASCCCCYCCLSPTSCNRCCYSNRRHSSYKLSEKSKHSEKLGNENFKKNAFLRRQTSDVADFSQLYDSCPHLINSKSMPTAGINMDTSCTTIDTFVSPVSPCSSFRSFIESGTLTKENKPAIIQNDLNNSQQQNNINIDKINNVPSSASSVKGVCSRPFSYIKNINDRAQILRRFTQHENSIPETAVPLDVTRIPSSSESDSNNQSHLTCTNIYETVLPPANGNINKISTSDISTPIYETEWTHSLRQLMMSTTSTIANENISVIELPTIPPDLVPSTKQTSDYFQQQCPYDKFLASRSATSDSMRRANMLRRLKDDAAFLY